MTRVLHVFGQMERGGAEMRTVELMRTLDPAIVRLDFCVLTGRGGLLDDEIRSLGGEVHPLALGSRFPVGFVRLLRRQRYDVVHAHVHHASGLMVALAALAGVGRRIVHYRSCDDGRGDGPRRRAQNFAMRRLIDRHATHILAVSEGALSTSWGPGWRSDARCRVIYNAIDLSAFAEPTDRAEVRRSLGIEADAPMVIHIGRMTAAKNHRRLIRMFAAHHQLKPETRLVLVGRDVEGLGAQIRSSVERLGLDGHVSFLGEREDVPDLLAAADLMLFPSLWEGLPGAVLEACAAGTPVLASAIPPIREIQRHFPLLRAHSLGKSNESWARAIVEELDDGATDEEVALSRFALRHGPFSMKACREAHLEAWGRGVSTHP